MTVKYAIFGYHHPIGTGLLPAGSGTATGGPDPGMASERSAGVRMA